MAADVSKIIKTVADKHKPGNKWIVTFADMMMLLLCFFVLLFSFSNTDLQRFKLIAESMKSALGVNAGPADLSISSGSNIIALESGDNLLGSRRYSNSNANRIAAKPQPRQDNINQLLKAQLSDAFKVQFNESILAGHVSVQVSDDYVRITMKESTAFPSGSGFIQPQQRQLIGQIGEFLEGYPGRIEVIGHTDNLPIDNDIYSNNVALSIARASAVASIINRQLSNRIVTISGKGPTEPLTLNDTVEGRQANRRVEIVISQGRPQDQKLPQLLKGSSQ